MQEQEQTENPALDDFLELLSDIRPDDLLKLLAQAASELDGPILLGFHAALSAAFDDAERRRLAR